MGLLDSFEKGLERVVNGAFAKTFRSGIQPVEIASALRREVDTRAAVVSRDRILVPNSFTVMLSPDDYSRMTALGSTLQTELTGMLQTHATSQRYSFAGPIEIKLTADNAVSSGTLRVTSQTASADRVSWRAVVDIDGTRHPLSKARTVIGRGSDADITIADAGTSRRHVEILWDGERAMARDLGSTNGSMLDGRRFTEAALEPDSTIRIGRTQIVFRVIAQAAATGAQVTDATRTMDQRGSL